MPAPRIRSVRLAAAHEGIAELIVDIEFDTGGVTEVTLDHIGSEALMDACGATTTDELIGHSWERVRHALDVSWNRFQ